jgi:LmbE family N-acetylglucosaminyl deacetylase
MSHTNINKNKRIIVFAPHPDDETLGCGGTIAKKIAEGYEVLIVVMTDGRFLLQKNSRTDSYPTPEQVKEIRRAEVLRATKILGVPEKNVIFLDFVDGTLKENEKAAEEKIIMVLKKFLPLEVYFPYEKDNHIDHKATNRIVRKVFEKLNLMPKMYGYSIAQKFARVGPIIEFFLNFFYHNIVYVDISKFLSLKREAVNEFKIESSKSPSNKTNFNFKRFDKYLEKKEKFYIIK